MAAATLAAELGLDTLLIDEQDAPGGQIYRGVERAGDTLAARRRLSRRTAAGGGVARQRGALPPGDHGVAHRSRPARSCDAVAGRRRRSETVARAPYPARDRRDRAAGADPGLDPARGDDGRRRADPAQDRRPRARRAGGAGRAGAAALSGARCSWRAPARRRSRCWRRRRPEITTPPRGISARAVGRPPRARRRASGCSARCAAPGSRSGAACAGCGRSAAAGWKRVAWEGGEIAADHLLLHEGVIPNTQISLGLGAGASLGRGAAVLASGHRRMGPHQPAEHRGRRRWRRHRRRRGGGAVGPARRARRRRVARAASTRRARPARRADPRRRSPASARSGRFSTRSTGRPTACSVPADDAVIACRCEEVSVGADPPRGAARRPGPNQVKAFLRCGMGPCQGRICGPIVGAVIADARGVPIQEVGAYRPRAPYKPITLGALAGLEKA